MRKMVGRLMVITVLMSAAVILQSASQTKDEKVYLWIAKKYNSDKVFVISSVIESSKDVSIPDLKNKFKNAVVRKYGKDQKSDIEIDINGPKKDRDAIEKSREKQIERMEKSGWQVFEFKTFQYY
ncbi:MAG: hypothetical protein NZ521_00130 [Flammeovirgaceae bacterium]|nr:hypothetical protein [Flammeovirgaceae bacterium]MDW8286460.1 hypothetical protein [Flammeovirgaceae bacterium]